MAKFCVEITSPDGPFTIEEIQSAIKWLFNHDGQVIRGFYKITEMQEPETSKKVLFTSGMTADEYDLESPEMRPLMMEKIANNIAKFGSLEAWLTVFRQELFHHEMQADTKVQQWYRNKKQLEFIENYARTCGTEEMTKIDPTTPV